MDSNLIHVVRADGRGVEFAAPDENSILRALVGKHAQLILSIVRQLPLDPEWKDVAEQPEEITIMRVFAPGMWTEYWRSEV
jgi:hypothetical protein